MTMAVGTSWEVVNASELVFDNKATVVESSSPFNYTTTATVSITNDNLYVVRAT
jgi:hypothetical protein